MWEVEIHPTVRLWILEQDEKTQSGFLQAIQSLREKGPNLGRPQVDTVVGSKFKNLKELRPRSSGSSVIRALFAFDPRRKARLEEHLENESQD